MKNTIIAPKPPALRKIPIVFLASALATSAWGQSFVAIQNSGFEDPVIPEVGNFVVGVPDWSAFDGGASGVWNANPSDFPALAPEGTNIAYVYSSVAEQENGISQTLSAQLQEDATYTLTVEVGDPLFFEDFPGYRIQLLAGGSVLAEDDNTLTITPGEFATSTAVYAYDAADAALLGQPLEIRLLTKGLAIDVEVNFDDVQLSVALANGDDPYATWASTNAPGQNPNDDFDGDGVPNAIEFVLGGSKDTNDLDKLPIVATSGGDMTFTFVRDRDSVDASVSVEIEVGTDLVNWPTIYTVGANTAGSSAGVTVADNGGGTDTITLTVAQAPDTKKFARLKVVITP